MTYLTTDEQHDVLISLREVMHHLHRVDLDIYSWKWAVKAMACAVNGALVCNVTGTAQVGALKREVAKETLDILQTKDVKKLPDAFLASPKNLLVRAQGTDRWEAAGSDIDISADVEKAFDKLFEIRNGFEHFKPGGWSLETTELPLILSLNLKI